MIEAIQRFQHTVTLFHRLGGAARVYRGHVPSSGRATSLAPVEKQLLSSCESGAPLGRLVDDSSFDEVETLEAIHRLVDLGLLACE